MITNILKIGTMIVAGRWLKPRWKGLIVLIAFWLVVRLLHSEYVQYVQLSGDTHWLWQASLAKVGLYLLGLVVYLLTLERSLLLKAIKKPETPVSLSTKVSVKPSPALAENDDGFDFLRSKKKLATSTDKLLQKD